MTTTALYKELNYVNHSREKRMYYANFIKSNPDYLPQLIDILFMVDDKISCRAAWVLEFYCNEELNSFTNYLDDFLPNLKTVHLDAAVRPITKICEYIAKAYYSKTNSVLKTVLTKTQINYIVEHCFDMLITKQKVAPKAYAMHTLFLFGQDLDWIYPELLNILERDFKNESAAFKARARQIISKIKV